MFSWGYRYVAGEITDRLDVRNTYARLECGDAAPRQGIQIGGSGKKKRKGEYSKSTILFNITAGEWQVFIKVISLHYIAAPNAVFKRCCCWETRFEFSHRSDTQTRRDRCNLTMLSSRYQHILFAFCMTICSLNYLITTKEYFCRKFLCYMIR